MITEDYSVNGNKRTIQGKVFGNEFRVYRIYGDITKSDELAEMAQEIAIKHNVERVKLHG